MAISGTVPFSKKHSRHPSLLKELDELNATDSTSVETGNNEVLFAWLEQSILKQHTDSYPRLESFLINVGQKKVSDPHCIAQC